MDGKKELHRKIRCDVKRCKAACCYNVPMPRGYLSAYRKKIINPVLGIEEVGDNDDDMVVAWTDNDIEKNKCPFLREDCRCNIYEMRPHICRIFGDGKGSGLLNCEFRTGKPTDYGFIDALLEANKDVLERLKKKGY